VIEITLQDSDTVQLPATADFSAKVGDLGSSVEITASKPFTAVSTRVLAHQQVLLRAASLRPLSISRTPFGLTIAVAAGSVSADDPYLRQAIDLHYDYADRMASAQMQVMAAATVAMGTLTLAAINNIHRFFEDRYTYLGVWLLVLLTVAAVSYLVTQNPFFKSETRSRKRAKDAQDRLHVTSREYYPEPQNPKNHRIFFFPALFLAFSIPIIVSTCLISESFLTANEPAETISTPAGHIETNIGPVHVTIPSVGGTPAPLHVTIPLCVFVGNGGSEKMGWGLRFVWPNPLADGEIELNRVPVACNASEAVD